jgi:hypothetical protein
MEDLREQTAASGGGENTAGPAPYALGCPHGREHRHHQTAPVNAASPAHHPHSVQTLLPSQCRRELPIGAAILYPFRYSRGSGRKTVLAAFK